MAFYGIILFLCICSFLDLYTRYYAKYKYEAGVRPAGYFAANTVLREWSAVTSVLNAKKYTDIGFKTDSLHYSYPLWPMCKNIDRVEYIVPDDTASAKYGDKSFKPQALLWLGELESDVFEWHGAIYDKIYSRNDYYVLENRDYHDDPSRQYIMLETDPNKYFDKLLETDNTIFISLRETAANSITDEMKNRLYSLGVQSDLSNAEADSFFAILRNKVSIREDYGTESIGTIGSFDKEHRYVLISTGEGLEGYNSIEIDGFDFSQDLKGISIVVYDNDTDQVVDSVTIETDAGNGSLQRTEY